MNVDPGEGFDHVISGKLLCDGVGVTDEQVVIKVNGTVVAVAVTSGDGGYSVTLNLQAVDDKPTSYQIEVVYYGDDAVNLTGYAVTPNGTAYAVCTTFQYFGYKPACNYVTVTVEPASTQVVAASNMTATENGVEIEPPKKPEELEQEAKDSGWLRVEPEFSWWYPWFRLHLKLDVNLPHGNPNIDYGWSFLPFGESYEADDVVLANVLNDFSNEIQTGILADAMVGVILQFGTAALLGRTLAYTVMAISIYILYQITNTLILYQTSGGNPKAWLAAFITSAFSGTCGLVIGGINSVSGVLTSTSRLIIGKIQSVMHSLWAKGLNFFNITGIAFALIDFAFMVLYLSMYLASI